MINEISEIITNIEVTPANQVQTPKQEQSRILSLTSRNVANVLFVINVLERVNGVLCTYIHRSKKGERYLNRQALQILKFYIETEPRWNEKLHM